MNEQQYVLTEFQLQELVNYVNGRGEKVLTLDHYTEVSGNTSDGHHTFDELYEHRNTLFCALVVAVVHELPELHGCFWSRKHSDGTMFPNMIVVGMRATEGYVSYHMDQKFISSLPKDIERDFAPEWDGYTSNDVLDRLQEYFRP